MTAMRRDPLLSAAKALVTLFLVLVALLTAAMPVLIAAFYLEPGFLDSLGATTDRPEALRDAIATLLAGFAVLGAVGIAFFATLRRIIASVGAGDPFHASNARLIARLGWLMVAEELIALVLSGIAETVVAGFPDKDLNFQVEFSPAGILLALVLFILARVFRQGAAMRADLEGTV